MTAIAYSSQQRRNRSSKKRRVSLFASLVWRITPCRASTTSPAFTRVPSLTVVEAGWAVMAVRAAKGWPAEVAMALEAVEGTLDIAMRLWRRTQLIRSLLPSLMLS